MLPFPQEQTEPPFASPALQFPTLCLLGIILQQLWMREGSAAGLLLNAALQKGGEGGKKGNSTGSSNILLLPVCTEYVNTWHPLCYLFRAKVPT